MKTTDIIRRAGRNLRQAKGRTLLTALAISVGAFTITMALAAGAGGRQYLDETVSAAGDMRTIQVSAKQDEVNASNDKPQKLEDATSVQKSTGAFKELTVKDREKIASVEGVEKVLPIFSVDLRSVAANGSAEYVGVMQVQYDNTAIELSAGKLGANNEILPGQVVLPHKYVESFGFKNAEDALNKTVTASFLGADGQVFTRTFTIVAVDAQPSSPLAFYQDQFRISNKDGEEIAKAQRPLGQEETYFSLMVTAKEGANVDTVKQAIIAAGNYQAMTFAEMRTSIMQMVNIVQYGLMGFGALAVLASIFGVINTMYISVLERTQQIGLMKALGMRNRDVGRLFRFEAAWIGFLGGAIGSGSAVILGLILNPVIDNLLKLDGKSLLIFEPISVAVIIIALILVAVVSGLFPSRKAAKLDPIEALRTE